MHNLIFCPLNNRTLGKGGLAQLVERLLCKQNVNGSNPLTSTTTRKVEMKKAESGNEEFQLSTFKVSSLPITGPVAQLVRAPP